MKTDRELVHDIRSKISAINMAMDVINTNTKDSRPVSSELLELLEARGSSVYKDIADLCNLLKSRDQDA